MSPFSFGAQTPSGHPFNVSRGVTLEHLSEVVLKAWGRESVTPRDTLGVGARLGYRRPGSLGLRALGMRSVTPRDTREARAGAGCGSFRVPS